MAAGLSALVVHGHRHGNAVGNRPWISAECLARLRVAEAAVRRWRIGAVLFSGSGRSGYPSEARQMAAAWNGDCVRISLDEQSADSAENATAAITWAREIGATELVVVSSWWHFRLYLYYRSRQHPDPAVRYAWTKGWNSGVTSHLLHELRYLPRAMRSLSGSPRSAVRARG